MLEWSAGAPDVCVGANLAALNGERMLPARPEPQGRDWARGLDISCNGEPVRSGVDVIPSNITSVEHSNDYNRNTLEYTDEDWEALGAGERLLRCLAS